VDEREDCFYDQLGSALPSTAQGNPLSECGTAASGQERIRTVGNHIKVKQVSNAKT
jgi:hypothetical protein